MAEGEAPEWFSELPYTCWEGATKDLTYVSSILGEVLLLDDHAAYIHSGQERWWVEIPLFGSPYDQKDVGLLIAGQRIDERLKALGE